MRRVDARSVGRSRDARRVASSVAAVVAIGVAISACTPPPPAPSPTAPAELVAAVEQHLDWLDAGDRVRNVRVVVDDESVLDIRLGPEADASRNIMSITKSVVSLLTGIAIDRGLIPGVDAELGDLLPGYRDVMTDEVAAITLEQVLTHTAGFAAGGSGVEELDFWKTPDWVAAILLDRAERGDNGGHWKYSDASAHIVAAVLSAAVGGDVIGFAREALFDPLGIDSDPAFMPPEPTTAAELDRMAEDYDAAGFAWPTDPQGIVVGGWGLKLTAEHLSRIGRLVLQDGLWNETRRVSAEWIAASTAGSVETPGARYGYQWWVFDDEHTVVAALGYAGQLLGLVPDLDLLTVVTSEFDQFASAPSLYSTGNATRLLREVIVPAYE